MIYKTVTGKISIEDTIVEYTLTYKNVKNINLRIKSDGTINISARKGISAKVIENFLLSKADFILKALNKYYTQPPLIKYFEESEIKDVITSVCKRVYPYFEEKGIKYPEIKFRKMVSRWGSCHTKKGILTFNTYLMYAPIDCIEYVVLHEFTHFIEANHQRAFYDELSKVCHDWKECRNKLKSINIKSQKEM